MISREVIMANQKLSLMKEAYRTTKPFDGGLSPPTDKSNTWPWFGGSTFDKPRKDFDKMMGGDHMFTEDNADGTSKHTDGKSYWVNDRFHGEGELDLDAVNEEYVVFTNDGKELIFPDHSFAQIIRKLREIGKEPVSIRKRHVRALGNSPLVKKAASEEEGFFSSVANILPACFKIESEDYSAGKKETGSGFYVKDDLMLTCAHVVTREPDVDLSDISVYVVDYDRRYPAEVVDIDYDLDLALIRCDAVQHTSLDYKETDKIEIGDEIVCVGSPYGYDNNVTKGILSSKNRPVDDHDEVQYFFMDLSVFPGSSGGPVVDERDGLVIGIAAVIVKSVGNYGLNAAIPIEYAIKRFNI
jgi:S1-C subfamily serine protease